MFSGGNAWQIYVYVCIYMHICIYIYIRVYTCLPEHLYLHRSNMDIHLYICLYQGYIRTQMYIYAYIHIYMYTRVYICLPGVTPVLIPT